MNNTKNPCEEILLNWDSDWGYKKTEWWEEYKSPSVKEKKKHEWQAILLSFVTVYDCKHCGIKKEDAKSEYCADDRDIPPDFGGV